jgi:hypothetical protein
MPDETKAFYKTSEFYVTGFVMGLTTLGMLTGKLDFTTGIGILTGGGGLYSVARGLAKAGVPPEPRP